VPQDETEHTFGQIIREERLAIALTQEQLAEKAGLHTTYISLLERGLRNPSLLVVEKIANALQVSMTDLVAKLEARKRVR